MRGTLLIGLVAFVGCGASQAATSAVVAPVELQSAQLPASSMPSAFRVTLSGYADPSVNGSYNAPYSGSIASGHLYLGERVLSGPSGHVMVRVVVSHPGLAMGAAVGTTTIGGGRNYGAQITLPSAQGGSASLAIDGSRSISASPVP